mgnify:CR=1 FL=1
MAMSGGGHVPIISVQKSKFKNQKLRIAVFYFQ